MRAWGRLTRQRPYYPSRFPSDWGCLSRSAGGPYDSPPQMLPVRSPSPSCGYRAPSQAGSLGSKAPAIVQPIRSALPKPARLDVAFSNGFAESEDQRKEMV